MSEVLPRRTVELRSGMGDPGALGKFGAYGGRFVPESLVAACSELEEAFRDAWSVMMPFEVERIAIPMPLLTRGISLVPTYTRRPGLLTRCMPVIIGWPSPTYRNCTFSTGCPSSVAVSIAWMNPSAWSTRSTSRFNFDAGIVTTS